MNKYLIRSCFVRTFFLGVLITFVAHQKFSVLQHSVDTLVSHHQNLFVPQEDPSQGNHVTTSSDRLFGEIDSARGHEFNFNHGFSRVEQSYAGFYAHAAYSTNLARNMGCTRSVSIYLLNRSLLL